MRPDSATLVYRREFIDMIRGADAAIARTREVSTVLMDGLRDLLPPIPASPVGEADAESFVVERFKQQADKP